MDPLDLVDKKYIVLLKGKAHPTYPGVLAAAMSAGLLELSVKLIQAPNADNGGMAICEALARFPGANGQDRIFAEIGDCDGGNCTPHIAPHRVRMAATRAKGRALRDSLGIGVALAEEMSDDSPAGTPRAPESRQQSSPPRTNATHVSADRSPARVVANRPPDAVLCSVTDCGSILTEREISGCTQAGWSLMCYDHAREYKSGLQIRMKAIEEKAAGAL